MIAKINKLFDQLSCFWAGNKDLVFWPWTLKKYINIHLMYLKIKINFPKYQFLQWSWQLIEQKCSRKCWSGQIIIEFISLIQLSELYAISFCDLCSVHVSHLFSIFCPKLGWWWSSLECNWTTYVIDCFVYNNNLLITLY